MKTFGHFQAAILLVDRFYGITSWTLLVTSAGADARRGSCCDVNPLTVRELGICRANVTRESRTGTGMARWNETPDGRTARKGRKRDGDNPRANVRPFVWALSTEIHFPFRAKGAKRLFDARAARIRASSLSCTYAHYCTLLSASLTARSFMVTISCIARI